VGPEEGVVGHANSLAVPVTAGSHRRHLARIKPRALGSIHLPPQKSWFLLAWLSSDPYFRAGFRSYDRVILE
jgi:hypothetical protein